MTPKLPWNHAQVEWYGWTADGQLFDSSINRGEPQVEVQQQNVPKGFWEGGMRLGWDINDGYIMIYVCIIWYIIDIFLDR